MPDPSTPDASPAVFALVTDAVLDRAAIEAFVTTTSDGAVVTFEGVIRNHDHSSGVSALDYEAHPDAEAFLRAVCAEVATSTGLRIAAAHRIGHLVIGDVALIASVASPHRADAFAACAHLVDLIKERTPIWKRQYLDDGLSEWVGLA